MYTQTHVHACTDTHKHTHMYTHTCTLISALSSPLKPPLADIEDHNPIKSCSTSLFTHRAG
ncbi:unnamed protein product [Staurois parvus]|uniref:Uncharacterized protein n=1 Tax=Staurois parvus TaxID=386267 RepID=A0ABN9FLI5_9NEOB|nr:unnamed protein product [Staurois parvus]